MSENPTSLSREELYGQVWTTPMRRLAQEYGISDVGLAKICKRLDIPRPPVGYWAKREVGKAPPQPPLPKNTDRECQTITITPTPDPPEGIADSAPEYDSDIQEIAQRVKSMPRIVVPQSLKNPHYLVRLTEQGFKDAHPDPHNLLVPRRGESKSPLNIRVAKASIMRALRFYDALIKAVEQLGGKVTVEGKRWQEETIVHLVGEQAARLRVRERYRQERRKEGERKERFDWHKYTYTPRGILVVEFGSMYGRETAIEDTPRAPIEDQLNWLLPLLVRSAQNERTRRRRIEEDQRRRDEWERERHEKLELIKAEEARVQGLLSQSDAWHQSNRIREFVSAARRVAISFGNEAGDSFIKWSEWALRQADRIDPLVESPPSVIDEKSKYERQYSW